MEFFFYKKNKNKIQLDKDEISEKKKQKH